MNPQEQVPLNYEDEINLYDLWKVIAKRKGLIVGVFLVATIAAGIISLSMPKVYKVMTVLEIGETTALEIGKPTTPLENPLQVKTKVDTSYPFKTMSHLNISEENFPKIKADAIKNTNLVNIAIESPKPEVAVKILDDVVKQVVQDHGALTSNVKLDIENKMKVADLSIGLLKREREVVVSKNQLIKKNKTELQGQIQRIDSQIQSLLKEKARLNLQANPDNALSNLLFANEVQTSQRYRNELEDRLNIAIPKEEFGIKFELERIEKGIRETEIQKDLLQNQVNTIQETKVIRPPSYSKIPVKPKKALNITLAGMVGLFAGILIAFLMEGIEKRRLPE